MKTIVHDENLNLEELENSYYNDLISNKNNISYWYPKIKDCGIKQPKTFIYQVPKDVMKCFFHDNKDDSDKITEWVRNELYPNIPQELKNTNLFIKNGCFSNKFDFVTATPKHNNVECISECIQDIQYYSFCYDTMGNNEIAIRERIPYSPCETPCIYNGLPLRNEYRTFYDFTKHKLLDIVNYWDWDKCSNLKGVVDVGFGYGYGLENTKYEDSLLIELDDDVIVESKKSARKSIKEAKNNFNLYELQNYYPFKKEWENAIKSEGFKIHEVSGDKIVFAINTDEGKFYNKLINAEIIIEDNMPIFLAKLLSWLKLDFGCSWTFGDEEEVDGYQYIDFMIW